MRSKSNSTKIYAYLWNDWYTRKALRCWRLSWVSSYAFLKLYLGIPKLNLFCFVFLSAQNEIYCCVVVFSFSYLLGWWMYVVLYQQITTYICQPINVLIYFHWIKVSCFYSLFMNKFLAVWHSQCIVNERLRSTFRKQRYLAQVFYKR